MMSGALPYDGDPGGSRLRANEKKWLMALMGQRVQFDVPMRHHTTLAVGGPADAVVMPADKNELVNLVCGLQQRGIPCLVVGGGSNLLVQDGGIRGVVISLRPHFKGITTLASGLEHVHITVKAGTGLRTLCRHTLRQGLAGMIFAIGIPGSVGGAIAMNAGAVGSSMADVLEAITILGPDGRLRAIRGADLDFSYRRLCLPAQDLTAGAFRGVIIDGRFRFRPASPRQLKDDARKILIERRSRQPMGAASAGCFFKNPSTGPSAGELIDKAGLKGERVGDAQISFRHANFITNRGHARAADILALAEIIKHRVADRFGVELEPEVAIVGESNHASKSV